VDSNGQDTDRTDLEYQTAQSSAEHHDQLIWATAGIAWGASLVLLGFVLKGVLESAARVLPTIIALFGLIFICAVWRFARVWRNVRNRKYSACWELERSPQFTQKHHTRERSEYPAGTMTWWFTLVSISFILIWILVILAIWFYPQLPQ
jgi:hypothetical protein